MLNAPKQSIHSVYLLKNEEKIYPITPLYPFPLIADLNESANGRSTGSRCCPSDEIVVILRAHDELHRAAKFARESADVNSNTPGVRSTGLDEVHPLILIRGGRGVEGERAGEIGFRDRGEELEGLRSADDAGIVDFEVAGARGGGSGDISESGDPKVDDRINIEGGIGAGDNDAAGVVLGSDVDVGLVLVNDVDRARCDGSDERTGSRALRDAGWCGGGKSAKSGDGEGGEEGLHDEKFGLKAGALDGFED
jgi:hypothetical protein